MVAVVAVALLPAGVVLAAWGVLGRMVALALAGLLVVLVRCGSPVPAQRLVLGVSAATASVALISPSLWPAPGFLAPLAVWLAARRNTLLWPALTWLRRGRLSGGDLLAVAGIAAASGTALVIWIRWASPDVGPFLATARSLPIGLTVAALIGFATVNALGEELMFRGLVQSELTPILGPVAAVLCQAAGFGFLRWHGVPSGLTGVLMATVYGTALSVVRHRTHGLLAAWTAHVAADATIGITFFTLAEH